MGSARLLQEMIYLTSSLSLYTSSGPFILCLTLVQNTAFPINLYQALPENIQLQVTKLTSSGGGACVRLVDNTANRLADNSAARLVDNTANRLADSSAARLVDNTANRLADNSAVRLVDKTAAALLDPELLFNSQREMLSILE